MPGRTTRSLSIAVVAGSLLAALPASAPAQSAADASCPPLSTGNAFTAMGRFAQTFTVRSTGKLTSAQVSLGRNIADPPGDYIFQIADLDAAGAPTNNVLASGVIPDASVVAPVSNQPFSTNFSAPLAVLPGQRYGLIITRAGSSLRVEIRGGPDSCPGGSFFSSPTQAGPFTDQMDDLVFTTFVDPPPTVAIGKKPKKKTRKRKARFGLSSNEPGARLECKLDKRAFKPCGATEVFKKLKARRHTLEVHSIDIVGNISPSAFFSWKVKVG